MSAVVDDLDDLLGDLAPTKVASKPKPKLSAETQARLREQRALIAGKPEVRTTETDLDAAVKAIADGEMIQPVVFTRPVGITFMASVLGVETRRLLHKLSRCPSVGTNKKGAPLYMFKDAIRYCVEPKIDMAQWIKSQSATSLPPMINKNFWEAERTKMRVKAEAGELWHTNDVLQVYGEAAMAIKNEMTLWIENLPGSQELTTEQYDALRKKVIELQQTITDVMVNKPSETKTRSYLADIEALEDEVSGGD